MIARPASSLLVAMILAGCSAPGDERTGAARAPARDPAAGPSAPTCRDDPLAAIEVAPADRVSPRYAQNFSIEYEGRRKRITIRNPWRGAGFDLVYLLAPCDEPAPPDAGAPVLAIPPARVVTTSTTELSHFVALGLADRIAGHNRLDYATEPEIRRRIESGHIVEIGDSVRLNPESLLALQPDLVLATSIGNPELDVFTMLERARLPFAVDAAWTEATPLGRAEWVKFTAAFFHEEAEANRLFDDIARRYEELAALGRSAVDRPTVLVGTPFQGTWHVSGGAAYQARLIADAGGAYLWADDPTTGSIPLDFETVYARGLEAEVWLHPYGWRSLADGVRTDRRMADFAAFRSGRVYNNDRRTNGRGGNDYWETGSLRPDLILADFLAILHPELLPNHQLVFHRRLPAR